MADRQTELLEEILAEQKAIRKEQTETNHRLETVEHGIGAVSAAIQKLDTKIDNSQSDTIDALKDLLLPPLESHEERITTLEEEVGIKLRKH